LQFQGSVADTIDLEAAAVTITSILCAVDFSRESPRVLRAAMAVAEREHASLTVLHVLDPLLVQAARIEYEQGLLETSADRDLRALIAETAKGTSLDLAAVKTRVRIGSPDQEILAEAAENSASLLVIGTHGFSGVRRMFFGSTAARVLARTTTPVMAMPPDLSIPGASPVTAPPAFHRLLVAVDFTAECMKAIKEAAALASRWQMTLTLLHAVPTGPGYDRWKTFLDLDHDKRITRARHELELLAAEIARERLAVRAIAVGGSPEEVIARIAAEEAGTLVVMGLRAPTLLPPGAGSTAYRLLCTTTSPVLVLPDVAPRARRSVKTGARVQERV
jgi:nucleotide-binding universal stress UspA family protein